MDGLGIALPVELNFPPPVSLPAGLKQTNLRQINYNQIPIQNGTPAATEIQVIIPQLDACFLDPHSTFLEVDAALTVNFSIPNVGQTAFLLSPSNSNGGIIGSAASIFQRYQLYLNNAIISDDESEFGLISYLQYLVSYNKIQRQALHAVLGLHPTNPNGIWGAPFHGQELMHRATMTVGGAAVGTNAANTIMGNTAYAIWNPIHGHFWAKQAATPTGAVTLQCVQDFHFNILLPGLIGSGNDKLFPLFNGPTMIKLYTDAFSNYFSLDFAPGINGTPAHYTPTSQFVQINSVTFVGDYVRCDPASFNAVMSGLPNPNMFVLKTTAWQAATAPIASSASGIYDVLIPHRRASIKVLYCLFNPQGANAATRNSNLWAKFASVCPNLTNGTCVALNGINYPQQTYDPMARPTEILTTLYKTIQTWANDGIKPLDPHSFYVCDGAMGGNGVQVSAGGTNFFNSLVPSTTSFGGNSYWRTYDTTIFRTPLVTGQNSLLTGQAVFAPSGQGFTYFDVTGSSNGIAPANTANAAIASSTTLLMTDKTAPVNGNAAANALAMAFVEGTTSSENCPLAPGLGFGMNMQSQALHYPWSDQFILAFDFEHLARNTALSGTSSLTGSFFLRMNIANPLRLSYLAYFIVGFDMLTILDTALRTAAVKM